MSFQVIKGAAKNVSRQGAKAQRKDSTFFFAPLRLCVSQSLSIKSCYNSAHRLLTLAALCLWLSLSCFGKTQAIKHPSRASHLPTAQQVRKIPFEMSEGGHIFLQVSVNGSEPLRFGLDSGAEQTIISQPQAEALKLKLAGGMQAAGGGEETVDFALAQNVSFGLQGAKIVLKEIGVLPLEFPSDVPGQSIAGLLGYDFMSCSVWEIDYQQRVISLYPVQGYRYRGQGESIAISMLDNNPHIPIKVLLPGLAPVRGMFVLDSGASTDLFFYSPFVKTHKLLASTQQTTEAETLGIGGTSKIRIGQATNIQLGRILLTDITVHFSTATKGDSASNIGAGFIGGKLLSRFKTVIFDPARKRVIFESDRRKTRDVIRLK